LEGLVPISVLDYTCISLNMMPGLASCYISIDLISSLPLIGVGIGSVLGRTCRSYIRMLSQFWNISAGYQYSSISVL